ncbi:MAG TPA: carboxypeptidase-like regulatory domain-containing protein, partial [Terriglobia bacterium]|nr:carboxypeptidase-like regulatory domain-containing protein [Terriglobia bacterium]
MRRLSAVILVLVCVTLSTSAFGQSSNATLSGTVSDAAKALIPGVTITATNTETGVVSTGVTNETGTYNLPGLLPGLYNVTAELPGFQTQTFTGVRLGNAAQVRLNFTLQVASVNTAVEVTVAADRLLLESTSSVGAVLPEKTVRDLPIVGVMGNDTLNLVRTLPGLNLSNDLIFAANDSKLAGVSASSIQIQRDGVDASAAGRWPAGIQGATIMNPDLIGEVRMILAPVDAEVGRGNSQIQVQTKSGTNKFHGAAVWNIRNSALDPNTWANNRVQPVPATRDWTNLNQYTGSVGGPIVKNKTFFFALWDGLLPAGRTNVNAIVLTPCARAGIFRYFD